ncbi:MAG: transposase [Actinomycetota bacterium]|nr:transposase [Actinomycetota bacterium]
MSSHRGRLPDPPEFKREAVELYRRSGKSLQVVAGEFGVAVESLRKWNKQHDIDAGEREGLTSAEREELRELWRTLVRVEQERDLLKRAAAFFARETETR